MNMDKKKSCSNYDSSNVLRLSDSKKTSYLRKKKMPNLYFNFTFDFQVVFKAIHLISIMGNDGTFNKPLTQILLDWELSYNVLYLLLCISGLCVHPFFFSGI